MKPQYRYEISCCWRGGQPEQHHRQRPHRIRARSRINKYMASRRFDMFQKLDSLAATLPPSRARSQRGGRQLCAVAERRFARIGPAGHWKSGQLESDRPGQWPDLAHRRNPVSNHLGAGYDDKIQACAERSARALIWGLSEAWVKLAMQAIQPLMTLRWRSGGPGHVPLARTVKLAHVALDG